MKGWRAAAGILTGVFACLGVFLWLTMPECLTVPGILTYRRVETVTARVPGEITSTFVRPGQSVSQGELLFCLDVRELEEDLRDLRSQRSLSESLLRFQEGEKAAAAEMGRIELAQARQLWENFTLSEDLYASQEGDRREAAYRHRKILMDLDGLKLSRQLLESAQMKSTLERRIRSLEKKVAEAAVRSPSTGVFLRSTGPQDQSLAATPQPGRWVASGAVLGYVADSSDLEIAAEAGLEYRRRFQVMDRVTIRVSGGYSGGREEVYEEWVSRWGASEKPGVFTFYVTWKGEGRPVPSGAVVELRVALRPLEHRF